MPSEYNPNLNISATSKTVRVTLQLFEFQQLAYADAEV